MFASSRVSLNYPRRMSRRAVDAMRYSEETLSFIKSLLHDAEIESTPRRHLVFGYLVVALEHQEAIINLVKLKLMGSAFALLRPQVETALRALWVNLIANDAQVVAIRERGAQPFPSFRDMAAELDTRYNAGGWMLKVADRWTAMNGYAHTGLEQLWRRFQVDGTIAPNYSDEVIKELLTYSATTSIVLVAAILRTVGLVEMANAFDCWLADHS
jgi:hypothetical protein